VASSGPHHPCVAGNSLPFWVLVWQRHAPTKRTSDSGVGTGQRPDLVQCSDVVVFCGCGGLVISP
jgi:hypothetical protein